MVGSVLQTNMSTESPPLAGEDPMVLFQGKRAAQRVRMELAASCSAATGASVAAKTIDVSMTGALLRLADPKALGISPGAGLGELAARIAMRFPGGVVLRLQGGLEDLRAQVVRVAAPRPPTRACCSASGSTSRSPPAWATHLGLPTAPDPGSPAALSASAASTAGSRAASPPAPPPRALPPPPPPPSPAAPPRPREDAPPAPGGPAWLPTALVYLLPAHAASPAARVRARRLTSDGLDLVAEIALAADEQDPMGVGAFLGEQPRLVLVHDGRVAYEGTVRLVRLDAGTPGVLRLRLQAERALEAGAAPTLRTTPAAEASCTSPITRV